MTLPVPGKQLSLNVADLARRWQRLCWARWRDNDTSAISRVEELQARITGGSENSNEAPLPLASLTTHIATKRDHDVERTR
jgi:hypothetical protein